MIKKTAAMLGVVTLLVGCSTSTKEIAEPIGFPVENGFRCEIVPLEEYGFDGFEGEKVCANPEDKADFIVIQGGYKDGDVLIINKE